MDKERLKTAYEAVSLSKGIDSLFDLEIALKSQEKLCGEIFGVMLSLDRDEILEIVSALDKIRKARQNRLDQL